MELSCFECLLAFCKWLKLSFHDLCFASGFSRDTFPGVAKRKRAAWNGCPIRFGLGIFGDKWTLLIIRDLMFRQKRYYGEFTDPIEGIATNILSDRLSRLQENQIIGKRRDPENGSRFVYFLTQKGKDLLPLMLAIVEWSEKYDPATEAPESFMRALRTDPEGLKKQILASLDD